MKMPAELQSNVTYVTLLTGNLAWSLRAI